MKNLKIPIAKKAVFIVPAFIIICLLNGCMMNFYKVKTYHKSNSRDITNYIALNKYFIIHQMDSAWNLSKPVLKDNVLSGELIDLPLNHQLYKTRQLVSANRYKKNNRKDESLVLNEVHLYLSDSIVPKLESVKYANIPITAISYTDVNIKAKGSTTVSWSIPFAITAIIIAAGVAAVSNLSFTIPY